jgi:ketosteroid isomerase-like protein
MLGVSTNPFMPKTSRLVVELALLQMLMLLLAQPVCAKSVQGGVPKVQRHESRHEIDQLEETWRTAVMNRDASAMDGLLSEDYMGITANGTLQTKEQALANLRIARAHINALDVSDRRVRFYGLTAVVTSLATVEANTGEADISGSFRYTRVYVRNPLGQWKIVSFEASRIRQPGERR